MNKKKQFCHSVTPSRLYLAFAESTPHGKTLHEVSDNSTPQH